MKPLTIKKAIALILPLLPILLYYDFPLFNINVGTTLCFLCFILFLCQSISKRSFTRILLNNIPFVLFFVLVFFSSFPLLLNSERINLTLLLFVMINMISTLFIWADNNAIDKLTLIKTYKVMSWIAIVFYLVQLSCGFVLHIAIPSKLPLFQLTESFSGISGDFMSISSSDVLEACHSLFSEQSHFAVYLLPLFHLSLVSASKNKFLQYLKAFFIGLIVLMVNSANGIIGLVIIFIFDLLIINKKSYHFWSFGSFFTLISVLLFVSISFLLINHIPYFNSMFSRLFFDYGNISSKAGYRIYRGFYIFGTLSTSQSLFGLKMFQIANYLISSGIETPFDLYSSVSSLEYTNFICQLLLYFGIVGFILFALSVFRFAKGKKPEQMVFLFCLIALWFSSSMLFEETFLFFSAFVVCLSKKTNKEKVLSVTFNHNNSLFNSHYETN